MVTKKGNSRASLRRAAARNQPMGIFALICTISLGGCADRTMVSAIQDYAEPLTRGIYYALPRGHVVVTAARTAQAATVTATSAILPDPDYRYNLSFRPQIFADDTLSITVLNGMLTSDAKSENTDQGPAIIKKLLDIAEAALPGFGEEHTTTAATYSITQVVDPFDPASIRSFNATLKASGETRLELFVSDKASGSPISPYVHSPAGQACDGSICFRLPVAVFVGLRERRNPARIVDQATAFIPDPRFTASIDIRRAPCITQVTTLTFTTGMLTKNDLDKPSELLKCLEIPANIISSLTGDLGKALGFRDEAASPVTQTVIVASQGTGGVTTPVKGGGVTTQINASGGQNDSPAHENPPLTHTKDGKPLPKAN